MKEKRRAIDVKGKEGNFYSEERDTAEQRKKRFFMADLTFVTVLGTSMQKHMKRNEWLSIINSLGMFLCWLQSSLLKVL